MTHSSEAFKKLYCRLLKRHYFTSFCVCVSVCHFFNMLTTIVSDHFNMVLGLHRQKKTSLKFPVGVSMATQLMARGMIHIRHKSNTSTGFKHFRESLIVTPLLSAHILWILMGRSGIKTEESIGYKLNEIRYFRKKSGKTAGMRDFDRLFCPWYTWLIVRISDQNLTIKINSLRPSDAYMRR